MALVLDTTRRVPPDTIVLFNFTDMVTASDANPVFACWYLALFDAAFSRFSKVVLSNRGAEGPTRYSTPPPP